MAEKTNVKLRHQELVALGRFLEYARTQLNEKVKWHHLLNAVLVSIIRKKLAPVVIYPKPETRLSFKQEEALAITIACEMIDLVELDNYTAAVMIDLSSKLK